MNLLVNLYAITLTILSAITPVGGLFTDLHDQFARAAITETTATKAAETPIDLPAYKPFPYKSAAYTPYQARARSAAVYDLDSASYLYTKNHQQQLPIASITKIVTALVILQNHDPDDIVTIPEGLELPADAERIGIKTGEQFRVDEALRVMLIPSANDMAQALAIWDAGSLELFATKMNEQARLWSLKNSQFKNPTGLDQDGHYASIEDLVTVAIILLQNDDFRAIIATDRYTATNQAGKRYSLVSTNKLLSYPYIKGLKTGLTIEAGQTLVTLAQKADQQLIGVVLNSPDRFQESKNMLDWAFANHIWK